MFTWRHRQRSEGTNPLGLTDGMGKGKIVLDGGSIYELFNFGFV
jgi:hypothetical protein